MMMIMILFTQPLRSGRIWHKVNFFKAEFNRFEFRVFFLLSLPYYLPIAGGRIIGFIPFPRVLVLCEMQSVSSRIWTRVDTLFYLSNPQCFNLGDYFLQCIGPKRGRGSKWPSSSHVWNPGFNYDMVISKTLNPKPYKSKLLKSN